VEYELPFIDKVVRPIIPDEATQVAALRTGKIDYAVGIPTTYWDSLDNTVPELIDSIYGMSTITAVALRCDEPPFDDTDVRRAMMVGTDREQFADLLGVGPLPVHVYPLYPDLPESMFTPLEELPADCRMLYDYDPELAMEMLADAGYPNGFTIDYSCTTAIASLDKAALLKYQWEKIGVTVNIKALEQVAFSTVKWAPRIYSGSFEGTAETANPLDMLVRHARTDEVLCYPVWSDAHYDEMVDAARVELDADTRNALIKEAALYLLYECPYVPLNAAVSRNSWWPWVKNYYGECYLVEQDSVLAIMESGWLDQDLKEEMGY